MNEIAHFFEVTWQMVCKYATYAAQQGPRKPSKFHQEESSLNNIIWLVIQLFVLWPRICHNEGAVATKDGN